MIEAQEILRTTGNSGPLNQYGVRARFGFSDSSYWTDYIHQDPPMFNLSDPYGHVKNPGMLGKIIKVSTTDPSVQFFISIDLYIRFPM